ncbi:MAG: TonB-dependent receptor [Pseudomonadota bacterium]
MQKFYRRTGTKTASAGLFLSVCSIALSMPYTAQAQDMSDGTTEVISVTARKRAEDPQEVPISLDVIGGSYLEQTAVNTLDSLQFSLPGVSIEAFENAARVTIRGVGSATSGLGAEDSTSIHQDGVYLAFPGQALGRLFDVERMEILKGPQGTLYGRNATAGVINIVSRRPDDELGGMAEYSYGSFDTHRLIGAINLPVNDRGGVRISGTFGRSDGFLENGFGGDELNSEDYWGIRVAADYELLDTLEMKFTMQYVADDSQAPNALAPPPENPGFAGFNIAFIDDPVISEQEDLSIALQFDLDLGDVTLRSLTGYASHDAFNDFDCDPENQTPLSDPERDGCTLIFDENFEQFSQELQAMWSSTDGDTDAVLGLYYLNTDGGETRFIGFRSFDNIINSTDTAGGNAYGVFAEVNHYLNEKFRLNVGLRYNYETRDASTIGTGVFDFPDLVVGDDSYSSVSGRVGLDYFVADETMIYASVSRGFKAGGLLPVVLSTSDTNELDSFDPETLWAYEVGIKHTFPDDYGIFNAAFYYYDYSDIQVEAGVFDLEDGLFFDVDNATKATIWGIDATYAGNITDYFGVDLTVSYINSEFGTFETFDFDGNPQDFTNNRLPRAPRFSSTVGLNLLDVPIAGNVTLSGRFEYNYRSKIFFAADNFVSQESLNLLNAHVQVSYDDNRYFLRVAGRNLTDEGYVVFNNGGALAKHGRPQEFLVTLGANF